MTELVPADLMIEAVVEDAAIKEDVFRRADAALPPRRDPRLEHELDPDRDARRRDRPGPSRWSACTSSTRCRVMTLVEVIRADSTSDETAAAIVALARDLGKEPVEARDVAGFVSNRILMPFINEAAYALSDGVAEPQAIDTVAKLGFAHPIGPLALADLIGLDTCVAIMEVLAARARRREVRALPAARRARPGRSPRPQVRAAASTPTNESHRAWPDSSLVDAGRQAYRPWWSGGKSRKRCT